MLDGLKPYSSLLMIQNEGEKLKTKVKTKVKFKLVTVKLTQADSAILKHWVGVFSASTAASAYYRLLPGTFESLKNGYTQAGMFAQLAGSDVLFRLYHQLKD